MNQQRPNQTQVTAALVSGNTALATSEAAFSKPVIATLHVLFNLYWVSAFVYYDALLCFMHNDEQSQSYATSTLLILAMTLVVILEALRRGIGAVYEREREHPVWRRIFVMFCVNAGLHVLLSGLMFTERWWR